LSTICTMTVSSDGINSSRMMPGNHRKKPTNSLARRHRRRHDRPDDRVDHDDDRELWRQRV